MLRPFSGSSLALRSSTTVPSEDVSVWSNGVVPVTSTVSLTWPTGSDASTVVD